MSRPLRYPFINRRTRCRNKDGGKHGFPYGSDSNLSFLEDWKNEQNSVNGAMATDDRGFSNTLKRWWDHWSHRHFREDPNRLHWTIGELDGSQLELGVVEKTSHVDSDLEQSNVQSPTKRQKWVTDALFDYLNQELGRSHRQPKEKKIALKQFLKNPNLEPATSFQEGGPHEIDEGLINKLHLSYRSFSSCPDVSPAITTHGPLRSSSQLSELPGSTPTSPTVSSPSELGDTSVKHEERSSSARGSPTSVDSQPVYRLPVENSGQTTDKSNPPSYSAHRGSLAENQSALNNILPTPQPLQDLLEKELSSSKGTGQEDRNARPAPSFDLLRRPKSLGYGIDSGTKILPCTVPSQPQRLDKERGEEVEIPDAKSHEEPSPLPTTSNDDQDKNMKCSVPGNQASSGEQNPGEAGVFHFTHGIRLTSKGGRYNNNVERGCDHSPDGDDDDNNNRKKRRFRAPESGRPKRQFACPYYKYEPNTYNGDRDRAYLVCSGTGFEFVSTVRRHLERVHGEHVCGDCHKKFESREMLQHHAAEDCPRDLHGSQETRWYNLWRERFPGTIPPSSPYREIQEPTTRPFLAPLDTSTGGFRMQPLDTPRPQYTYHSSLSNSPRGHTRQFKNPRTSQMGSFQNSPNRGLARDIVVPSTDDTSMANRIRELESRVSSLEQTIVKMVSNSPISSVFSFSTPDSPNGPPPNKAFEHTPSKAVDGPTQSQSNSMNVAHHAPSNGPTTKRGVSGVLQTSTVNLDDRTALDDDLLGIQSLNAHQSPPNQKTGEAGGVYLPELTDIDTDFEFPWSDLQLSGIFSGQELNVPEGFIGRQDIRPLGGHDGPWVLK
ncbi:hypothetical protein FQN51_003229 [Onygenales sp. PD_10]|nr:hypothetical protein FQN51_003229 [Onygenales sp. PD_10]